SLRASSCTPTIAPSTPTAVHTRQPLPLPIPLTEEDRLLCSARLGWRAWAYYLCGVAQVFQTLVRCYFSPAAGTGQRYIISGSHDGAAVIYDLLSAEPVARLQARVRPSSLWARLGWFGLIH